MGVDLVVDEALQRAAKLFVFVGELHGGSPARSTEIRSH
jgi:hypothetical protein